MTAMGPGTAMSSTPVLGADLASIGTRPQTAMIASDLSRTLDDCGARAAQNAMVAAAVPSTTTVAPGGALPAWCRAIFSQSPLYTRFGPQNSLRVRAVFGGYVAAFIALVHKIAPGETARGAVSRGIRRYRLRHREDDHGLLLLERLFGKVRAKRYLEKILFPISIDGCAT